ncbi:hypothetical protein MTO96_018429 [Rhipicephalus appendiculatus]
MRSKLQVALPLDSCHQRQAASVQRRGRWRGKKGEFKSFVARAVYKGDVLPGKAVPKKGTCYVSSSGAEVAMTSDYQVLVSDANTLDWLPGSAGAVPTGAIQGGTTSSGERLYIGRCHHDGGLVVGKVHPSQQRIYIAYDGKEYNYEEYDVLVCKTINF